MDTAVDITQLVEREALAARAALSRLTDERVDRALARTLELLAERAGEVLAANERDLEAAAGRSTSRPRC